MTRRFVVLLFALAVAGVAVATTPPPPAPGVYQYIVPVTGNAEGVDALFYSSTRIINLANTSAAALTFDLYPADPAARCIDTPATIPAGGSVALGMRCEGIYAVKITSDRPLHVLSAVQSWGRRTFLNGPDEEPIEVAETTIRAGETALIPDVVLGGAMGWRANVALVNPNDVPLTVNVYADRKTTTGRADAVFFVAPRSLRLVSATAIPWGRGDGLTGAHDLRLVGDQPFQAGASSLRSTGNAQYRGAVQLDPR